MTTGKRQAPHLRLVDAAAPAAKPTFTENDWSNLMQRAQAGDGVAYHRLLVGVTPYLRALAARRFQERHDVEDVVQDILLTLHGIRATYDPVRPFGPWLVAIANRRMVDRLRLHYRRTEFERAFLVDEDFAQEEQAREDTSDHDRLRAALRELSPSQRQAIGLLKLNELQAKEAAAKSGIGVSALKVAAHRGVARLKEILAKRDEP